MKYALLSDMNWLDLPNVPDNLQFRWEVFVGGFFELLRQKLDQNFGEGSFLSEKFLVGSDFGDFSVFYDHDVVHFRQVRHAVSYLQSDYIFINFKIFIIF